MRDPSALARVCRDFDLSLVVLFGSRAKGSARPDSDSDVGVLCRRGVLAGKELLDLAARLEEATGLPNIDLVDLRRASGLLQHHAGTHGKPLYEDEPGRFNLFRVKAWRLYLDEAYTFRRHDARHVREALERLQA